MGSLRELQRSKRDRSVVDSEQDRLFARLDDLRSKQGKGWKEVERILRDEGIADLSANALRKRYGRWKESQEPNLLTSKAADSESNEKHQDLDSEGLQKTRTGSCLRQFEEGAALPALPPGDAFAENIGSLVDLNRQLLEQVQQSHRMIERLEKRLEMQEQITTNAGIDMEQPVTSRDLLELLKEFARGQEMQFIEENQEYEVSREEVLQLLDEKVQEKVDAELKVMLSAEGGFAKDLSLLVDRRLKSLFSGETVPTTPHAGPGRGKKGKSHIKFSASLEENLYARAKSLPGQFSRHLANALSTYLSVMEEKKED